MIYANGASWLCTCAGFLASSRSPCFTIVILASPCFLAERELSAAGVYQGFDAFEPLDWCRLWHT